MPISRSSGTMRELVILLRPFMQDERERRAYVSRALGSESPVLYGLVWNTPTNIFVTELVRELDNFGEISIGKPAIYALLEVIREDVGADVQKKIDNLLRQLSEESQQNKYVQTLGDDYDLRTLINEQTDLLQFTVPNKHTTGCTNLDLKVDENIEVWNLFIKENLYDTRRVTLEHFNLFEWFPLKPGKFHTEEAKWSRQRAKVSFKIQDENKKIYFDPKGKVSMVEGGVGAVRLCPRQINGEAHYFMTASSTGICHEGFPVLIPRRFYGQLKEVINNRGAVPVTLKGEMRYVPNDVITFFGNDREIPLLYLHVDEVQVMPKPRPTISSYKVSVAVSFFGEFEGQNGNYVTYASFDPANKNSLEQACEWLEQFYMSQYKGTIITDFDEVNPRFPKVVFGLPNLLSGKLNQNQVRDFLCANSLLTESAKTFLTQYSNYINNNDNITSK